MEERRGLMSIYETFANRDRSTGLIWAVVIAWCDFAFLYWAVLNDVGWATHMGLLLLAVACGLAVFFG